MSILEPLSDEVLATLLTTAADASGSIRYWNAAAEEMFGHPPEEAIGASLDLSIPEKLRGNAAGESRLARGTQAHQTFRARSAGWDTGPGKANRQLLLVCSSR